MQDPAPGEQRGRVARPLDLSRVPGSPGGMEDLLGREAGCGSSPALITQLQSWRRGRNRKPQAQDCTAFGSIVGPQMPIVCTYDRAADCEPETQPFFLGRHEGLENSFEISGRNAASHVLHFQFDAKVVRADVGGDSQSSLARQ